MRATDNPLRALFVLKSRPFQGGFLVLQLTSEKIPGNYAISRNVYRRVRKFDDVESAKR